MRFEPESEAQAAEVVSACAEKRLSLRLEGGGTRSAIGRPIATAGVLSSRKLSGVTLYEPAEMVVSVRAGTPLAALEDLLAGHGQMLPFEPPDYRVLLDSSGEPTVGGIVAGNLSGPRRVAAGACRDSLIGLRLINGTGEILRAGGRVMKNVTGLDLVKLLCGSWGTLALITEATFKLLPRPEDALTLCLRGLSDAEAVAAMCAAMGTPFAPSAAAHLPAGVGSPEPRTLLRLEGFRDAIRYRAERLAQLLAEHGRAEPIEGAESAALWRAVRDVTFLAEPRDRVIWRLSLPPRRGAEAVARIREARPCTVFYDWSGGLVWLATSEEGDGGAAIVRAAVEARAGHAWLMRAAPELRARVPPFPPRTARVRQLEEGLKKAFDPFGLFNPGLREAGL